MKKSTNNCIYSNQQPLWQLFLLNITTLGLYQIYWFYKNWARLYPYNGIKVKPWLRTIGLFIPFVNLFLVWDQFIDIKTFLKKENVGTSFQYPGWATIFYVVTSALSWNPEIALPIALLTMLISITIILMIQKAINQYWKHEQPNTAIKKFSLGEIILCCILPALIIWSAFYAPNENIEQSASPTAEIPPDNL